MMLVPPDAVFVRGLKDENCVDACARAAGDWAQLDHAGGAASYAAANVRVRPGHAVEYGSVGVTPTTLRTSQQQQHQQKQQAQSASARLTSSLRALTSSSSSRSGAASTTEALAAMYERSTLTCNAQLLPLLHEDCEALQELMGCERCMGVKDAQLGWSAPGMSLSDRQCLLSRGNYLTCRSKPPSSDFVRACVCEISQLESKSDRD